MPADDVLALMRTLGALAEAQRTFSARGAEFGDASFELRIPTRGRLRILFARAADVPESALASVMQRPLLIEAIVSWRGVLASDVHPDAPDAPLPFSADAAELLLEAKPEWELALYVRLLKRFDARTKEIESAEKNSART